MAVDTYLQEFDTLSAQTLLLQSCIFRLEPGLSYAWALVTRIATHLLPHIACFWILLLRRSLAQIPQSFHFDLVQVRLGNLTEYSQGFILYSLERVSFLAVFTSFPGWLVIFVSLFFGTLRNINSSTINRFLLHVTISQADLNDTFMSLTPQHLHGFGSVCSYFLVEY